LGYYVEIDCKDLIIPRSKVADCLKAINALWKPNGQPAFPAGTRFKGGKKIDQKGYKLVPNPPPGGYPTIIQALEAWRYKAIFVGEGDVVIESFEGGEWGDDRILYQALAPFLRDGGSIVCYGEDDRRWRYLFHDGKVEEQHARLIWR